MMDESYDKSGPPPTYDDGSGSQSQRTTTTTSTSEGLHFNRDYITTIPAILKYAEAAGSLICMISASIYIGGAAGWCGFTAGTALFTIIVWYFFYLFNIISKLPAWHALFELIYYIVIAVCYLISSILAAATAAGLSLAGFGVYAFFGFVTLGVFCVDIFFQFKKWRSEGHTQTHTQTTTTTTTTGGSSVI